MAIYIKTSNTNPNAFMPYNRYPDVMIANTSGGRKAPTITKCTTLSDTYDVHVPDYLCFSATGTQNVRWTSSGLASLQYSYDKIIWNDMQANTSYDCATLPLYVKTGTTYNAPYGSYIKFSFTNTADEGPVTVSGNIASIFDGCGSQEFEHPQAGTSKSPWINWPRVSLSNLFNGAAALVDVSGLILP